VRGPDRTRRARIGSLSERLRREVRAGKVYALLAALGARDGCTRQHSQAVVKFALPVGRRLGLDVDSLRDLESAALLHDIGKIGIPDSILKKRGPLTEEEWAQMRRHPAIGADIVASMATLSHLAPVTRAGHERWDGRGYPDGLRGTAIPLLARIVFVCDAMHAMTSDRPYRRAMPMRDALDELEQHAGTQFCPGTVTAALEVVGRRTRWVHSPAVAAM
jgi:HD-GYP domain-containing protein (c-di-GMP phosphodiesterase class II)